MITTSFYDYYCYRLLHAVAPKFKFPDVFTSFPYQYMKEIIVTHKAEIVENVKAAETLLPPFVVFASLNITFG